MNTTTRNLLTIACILLAGFLVWYFSAIVLYIVASLVLTLIGRPIFDLFGKVHFGKVYLHPAIKSLLTLIILILIVLTFFGLFIPLLVIKVQELSAIDPQSLIDILKVPAGKINRIISRYDFNPGEAKTVEEMVKQVIASINIGSVAEIFGSVAGWLGNLSVAFGSIAFITFFFLKDDKLFSNAFLKLIPGKYKEPVKHAMDATRALLSRYFVGILIEVTGVIILSTIGFLILGFPLKDALLVGFLAGIFNIVPYLGPIIGTAFAVFVGIISYLGNPEEQNIVTMAILIIVVCIIVQWIDNMLIQPYVYSNSVRAHPLEIFLIFLLAGTIGGFGGMILAIPAYIVIREFSKEIINKFKVVQSGIIEQDTK